MALNTVSSDRLSTNVKNTNFTAAEKQDLTDDIKPLLGSAGGGNKNLIINGAMQVAQRGTSSTAGDNSFTTVDRFRVTQGGLDEDVTQEQADVASGTTPYTSGFRKCFKITNGNQTSGAGADDSVQLDTKLEAQDIANSGWNYLSSSSYITLSFWVKSSVAQNFFFRVQATDGTAYNYVMETGSLSADTWTKITKSIPGNSNLTFNNDNGEGLLIRWAMFRGTNQTGTRPLNAWAAYDGASRYPDNTSTWFTTNNATFELTGVQLEVGSVATDFEHRSFGQELALCQRYFNRSYAYGTAAGTATTSGAFVHSLFGAQNYAAIPGGIRFTQTMRTTPSITIYSTYNANVTGKLTADSTDKTASIAYQTENGFFPFVANSSSNLAQNVFLRCQYTAEAEL